MFRTIGILLFAVGGLMFVAAIVYPAFAISYQLLIAGPAPIQGWSISFRQWQLLLKSVALAGAATALAMALAVTLVYLMQRGGSSLGTALIGFMAAMLLCPPMVFAFGWERILSATMPLLTDTAALGSASEVAAWSAWMSMARCVAIWSLWIWPVPTVILAAASLRKQQSVMEAGALDASYFAVFVRIVIPGMMKYIVVAGLIVFIVLMGEYGVPHACGLTVYATELLGWASSSFHAIDTAWPALPLALVITAAMLVLFGVVFLYGWIDQGAPFSSRQSHQPVWMVVVVSLLLVVGFAFPLVGLLLRMEHFAEFVESWRVYHAELLATVGIAVLAGVTSAVMGVSLMSRVRAASIFLVICVLSAAIPGALVGKSLIAAYLPRELAFVYDTWLVIWFCFVARFGWVGILTGFLAWRTLDQDTTDQMRLDGVDRSTALSRILIPMNWPILLAAVAAVVALSVGELPASTLVRVPQVNLLAHIIIEKFHRFEDGTLVSLSLWLMAIGTVVGLAIRAILLKLMRTAD